MYKPKYAKKAPRSARFIALLVCVVFLLGTTVGGTVAFLVHSDEALVNRFEPSQVTTAVNETRNGLIKSDVHIRNTGNTQAWLRAAVVITWQDEDGNVYGQAPAAVTDYVIVWGEKWLDGADGFYYWPSPVAPDGITGDLIESITPVEGAAPDGYYLTVEILGSGIQRNPASVFNTEWESSGLSVSEDGSKIE